MLQAFRRLAMLGALVSAFICIVLLLNFTAPNPTGRRYSSEIPVTTGEGTSQEIGISGERVLAKDLQLPRNENPDQLQCMCNSTNNTYRPPLNECRVCFAFAQLTSEYRRPDFVAPTFIAESKNAQNLFYERRDFTQIGDYAIGARALARPLWVFVRVNTYLDPEFYEIVEATGGGVVHYFTVQGYVDPVDYTAWRALAISVSIVVVMGLFEANAQGIAVFPARPTPKPRPVTPRDPVENAVRKSQELQSFKERATDRARKRINIEDSRNDGKGSDTRE
jgi:hypothetical protein